MSSPCLFCLLLLTLGIHAVPVPREGHPNVLLIVVDDLRPLLGCYKDEVAITPAIDAIASLGVTFSRAYAQQALCGPSRTSFLTSRRPLSTGVLDVHRYWRSYGNYSTLPQHFKQHGYFTASAGKVFHPGVTSNFSDDALYSWTAVPFHPSTFQYKNAPVCGAHHNSTDIVCPVNVWEQPEATLPDLQTAHYAISFLQNWLDFQRKESKHRLLATRPPFFLAVGFHKPHIPLKYPREFTELFPLARVPLPPNRHLPPGLPPVAYNPWNDLRWRDDIRLLNLSFPYQPIPDEYARLIIQSYYAATTYTDSLIGELLATAESLFPDTLVVFLGDHGWSMAEHQEWSKFSNYEVSTRVPFIIAKLRGFTNAWQKTIQSLKEKSSLSLHREAGEVSSDNLRSKRKSDVLSKNVTVSSVSTFTAVIEECLRFCSPPGSSIFDFRKFQINSNSSKLCKTFLRAKSKKSKYLDTLRKECIARFNKQSLYRKYNKLKLVLRKGFHLWSGNNSDVNYESYWNFDTFYSRKKVPTESEELQAIENHVRAFRQGVTYDGIVELLDLFPTLADLAGIQKVPRCSSARLTRNKTYNESTVESIELLCTEGKSLSKIIIDQKKREKRFFNSQTAHDRKKFNMTRNELNNAGLATITVKNSRWRIKNFGKFKLISSSPKYFPVGFYTDKNCADDLRKRRVALSVYPRPSLTPSIHPDSDQPRLNETVAVGVSLRSLCYRYTVWAAFNYSSLQPELGTIFAEELYDHRTDPGEDRNIEEERLYERKLALKRLWKIIGYK